MNYKVSKALKANRKSLIVIVVLWVILSIVLVAPLGYSIGVASQSGTFDFEIFLETIFVELASFTSFTKVFDAAYIGYFGKTLLYFTIIYIIFAIVGIYKSKPKNEFTDIEHGSSDWSENGEQYRILSKNHGIILSKHNYLPVDKRGNVNVLVVGRFRFW